MPHFIRLLVFLTYVRSSVCECDGDSLFNPSIFEMSETMCTIPSFSTWNKSLLCFGISIRWYMVCIKEEDRSFFVVFFLLPFRIELNWIGGAARILVAFGYAYTFCMVNIKLIALHHCRIFIKLPMDPSDFVTFYS